MSPTADGRRPEGPQDSPPALVAVRINGEDLEVPAGLHLEGLLRHCGYEPRLVVVEFNGEILPRRHWPEQVVAAGDRLEIVTIVGGGS